MTKTVIIVQARLDSTRLPGKVLRPVLGRPLLAYQVERLKRVTLADDVVIATTTNSSDNPIVRLCESQRISVFRGSEKNVLERHYAAAKAFGADVVVRVSGDCPLMDPLVVDRVIRYFLDHRDRFDFVSNCPGYDEPSTYPRGMDVEVFSFRCLEEAHREAREPLDREHVTRFIRRHGHRFGLDHLSYHRDEGRLRLTVDTEEDFELVRKVLEDLYPKEPAFSLESILSLMQVHPDWEQINSHIEQERYGNH